MLGDIALSDAIKHVPVDLCRAATCLYLSGIYVCSTNNVVHGGKEESRRKFISFNIQGVCTIKHEGFPFDCLLRHRETFWAASEGPTLPGKTYFIYNLDCLLHQQRLSSSLWPSYGRECRVMRREKCWKFREKIFIEKLSEWDGKVLNLFLMLVEFSWAL